MTTRQVEMYTEQRRHRIVLDRISQPDAWTRGDSLRAVAVCALLLAALAGWVLP